VREVPEGRACVGKGEIRGPGAQGYTENGEHGMRSRRQTARIGLGRKVSGSRSVKKRHLLMHWSTAGSMPISCS
jgi:hypothetical protein